MTRPSPHRTCGACGVYGPIEKRAVGEQPDVCRRCYCQARPARVATCADCGERRPPHRRVAEGVICGRCALRSARTTAACQRCSTVASLSRRLCPVCRLGERVDALARTADLAAAASLRPFLDRLVAAPNPASTLRWLQGPARRLLEQLLAGGVPISHQGLDHAQAPAPAVTFLRSALVDTGVLPARDEQRARFERWQRDALAEVAAGVDRAHLHAYASWQLAHELARARHPDRSAASSQKHARSGLREAIELTRWLHGRDLQLADLRQDLLDEWVAAGASTRRVVRLFTQWLGRAGVTAALSVEWNVRGPRPATMSDSERFAILRRLLEDPSADPRDRLAGCLLLLYAQPLTRTAALHASDVTTSADGDVQITLGRGSVPLPSPLDDVAVALADAGRARSGDTAWLLPGRHAGTHLTAERLRERLMAYGISSRAARGGALLALAARLPAPVLAERLGIHQARAASWRRAAGATYADYVAIRAA